MASKTAVLIIPGSFSTAQMYYPTLDALSKLSSTLPTYVNNLPSAIRNPPEEAATLADDATFFRGIIEKLADQGTDVVLVGHSYGGVVATECVKGVTKAEREGQGLKGGVVRIVYLASHAPGAGRSLNEVVGDPPAAMVKESEVGA
jgi:pimeloyl-ACP methyl ester carboxylesterase